MKTLERMAIGLGLAIVGLVAVYRHVLNEDQRGLAREMSDAVRSATQEVVDVISPLVSDGPTRSEERAASEANRARTAAQWEALGY